MEENGPNKLFPLNFFHCLAKAFIFLNMSSNEQTKLYLRINLNILCNRKYVIGNNIYVYMKGIYKVTLYL